VLEEKPGSSLYIYFANNIAVKYFGAILHGIVAKVQNQHLDPH
jgi:hypothetical protein